MTAGAELFELPTPRIAAGEPANLTLVDLDAEWVAGERGWESRSENSCFAGQHAAGARAADAVRRRRRLPRARLLGGRRLMALLQRDRAALVVVDVQEGFRPYDSFAGVAAAVRQAARRRAHPRRAGARLRAVPQRPRPLRARARASRTSRASRRPSSRPCAPTASSLADRPDGRDQAVVCGIEAHVCVSQTVHDLLERGVEVHVPADAVGSRHEIDYERGLERLERAGAVVTTVEASLFELLGARRHAGVQGRPEADPVSERREGYVLLEDGTRFDGELCGAEGPALGEVVFTTGMSGYQESMTDPSFAGQLIAFTYPHIGNYGASAAAMESERPWARAAIMREAGNREDAPSAERGWLDWLTDCGISAISGVDTRSLVRHIRDAGAMRGGVFDADDRRARRARADRTPSRRWPGRISPPSSRPARSPITARTATARASP